MLNPFECTCDCHDKKDSSPSGLSPWLTHVFNEEDATILTMDFVNKEIHFLVYCWHCQRYFLLRWHDGYSYHMFEIKIKIPTGRKIKIELPELDNGEPDWKNLISQIGMQGRMNDFKKALKEHEKNGN